MKKSAQQPAIFEQWRSSCHSMVAIVENTPSGICITDEKGIFEYVNPAYCALYGYEPHEMIGSHFTMIVPEEHRAWLTDLHDRYIAGQDEVRGEWPVQNKAGEQLFVLADAVRITGADGHPKKVTFVTDITARKKAEEELARSENLLREAVATKDKFFSIIAHDLRNFFQALIAGAELLMLEPERPPHSRVLAHGKRMYQASHSALALLEDLLTWARSQTGAIECRPERVDLEIAVGRAMRPLANNAEMKSVAMTVNIPAGLAVFADPEMLNTILINLVGNALKFCSKGDSVTISAGEEGGMVTVSVCDTGVGMDGDRLGRLFQVGGLSKSTGTDGESGTGLGLILCKEFVEISGGKIWARSKAGKGSTFSFTLPASATAE